MAASMLRAALQRLPVEVRGHVEERLLAWAVAQDVDGWDIDISSDEICAGGLRWRAENLSLDALYAVVWKLMGVLHDRLKRGIDVPLNMSRYLWCTTLAKELPPNDPAIHVAIRLLASGRAPCTLAGSRSILKEEAATFAALDDAVLEQFGLPLWPSFRSERRDGDLFIKNEGIGAALAVKISGVDSFQGATRVDADLAPGQSIRVPTPRRGEPVTLQFEKYGEIVQAAVPAIDSGAPDATGCAIVVNLRPVIARRRLAEQRKYRQEIDKSGTVLGGSPALLEIFEHIHHANSIENGAAVLLLGEPGVGKTHIAKLLHDSSSRSSGAYKEVNAGGSGGDINIQKGEWVGYSKGHGISGIDRKGMPGHLTEVEGGTLFVDELAVFSHEMQVIFLSVLEKRSIQQVGGRTVTPNVRCVFATNVDLNDAVEKGKLRRDLLDRISVSIVIPPLRDRRGDVAALAKSFVNDGATFDDRCLLAMLQYKWPGNVRELKLKVQGALARANMEGAATIKIEYMDLPREFVAALPAVDNIDVHRELCTLADDIARAEGFEPGAGLQRRAAEILGVSEGQASKMYRTYGLSEVSGTG